MEEEKKLDNGGVAIVEQPKPMTELEKMQQRLDFLERHMTLIEGMIMAAATSQTVTKGASRFGSDHAPKKVLDTLTNITYDSLTKCGVAVGPTAGLPAVSTSYYDLVKMFPGRFQKLG